MKGLRSQVRSLVQSVRGLVFPSQSPSWTTSDRPILSITRKEVKELFWDIQVNGTHNYVTIDGAVHHNSTKTTASILKIAYDAKKVAPCRDGIRRSRIAVIRNTRQMLFDTTIPDFLKWFPDGTWGFMHKTESKYLLKFSDVECEVLFRGLDDANDVRRLLSLQLTFGFMDEFREINPEIYNMLTTRIGRYPDKSMNGVGCCDDNGKQIDKIWGSTNPPDMDTWWEQILTNPPENMSVVIQPGGMTPEADWGHYLKDNYYQNMMQGKTEDWIDVYVHGEFGKSLAGQPVFRCFEKATHVAKEPLKPLPTNLIIGVDAGLNPTAVITQQTHDGRVLVLDTLTGNEGGMGALRFIREKLRPLLVNKYTGFASTVIIDPAAFQRAQTDERSVADIFTKEGFKVVPARTNSIAARLAAGESFMTRTVNGNPALLCCPSGADLLVKALGSKYRYKINTKGEKDDKPEKSHPWSDVADAFTYACLTHDAGATFGGNMMSQRREMKVGRAVGWT